MPLILTPELLAMKQPPLTAEQRLEYLENLASSLEAASASIKKHDQDARQLLDFYWGDETTSAVDAFGMKCWLEGNQPLDWQSIVRLIELAGARALKVGQSAYKAKVAASKNCEARAWVVLMWNERADKKISKAKFSETIAIDVAKKFKTKGESPLRISAKTIETRWLPKKAV